MRAELLGMLIAMGAFVQSAQALEITDPSTAKIEGIVKLPIKGMQAVQSDGQILFMSENGRFVITGQIYDIWMKKPLSTIAQMQDAASRIHFKGMGLNVDTLNTVSMGQEPKEVVIFVDPRCTICHELMPDAKTLTKDYTFKFIVIPALGDESNRLAKALYCAKDQRDTLNALIKIPLIRSPPKHPAIVLNTIKPCSPPTSSALKESRWLSRPMAV
jgi:thiol:disulfide interchange protein DsbC